MSSAVNGIEKFKEYFQTFFTASLKAVLEEAIKRGL